MKKVSREGIVLIKSFEGFRPRAVARPEGGWIIGYGHTLSAREGATVSETDAELLLRYDLLAVEKRLGEATPQNLNQHQFDALASFAFSVGLDRFETSDVLSRLTSGDDGAAAEAMLAWPETRSPSAGARRRAAERALFTADPTRPVALAALLAAPLPEVGTAAEQTETPVEPVGPTAVEQTDPHPAPEPEAALVVAEAAPAEALVEPDPVPPHVAAVAALLGEAQTPVGPAAAPIVPTFETPALAPVEPEPSNAAFPVETDVAAEGVAEAPIVQAPANDVEAEVEPQSAAVVEPAEAQPPVVEPAPSVEGFSGGEIGESSVATLALSTQRYAPYGQPIIGPLPYLAPAADAQPARAAADVDVEPLVIGRPVEGLILTSPEDTPAPLAVRPAWTAEERAEVETAPSGESLFGEDLTLTQGGQPLGRSDFEPEAPERFDWSETGAFIVMGAVGLTAFGASMAAFRLASEQGGGDETSIIGWVLAVIGVACVGVSSFNLYRKFGLAGSDR
ncbi:lysozyme [Brevundimonas bacteroides]|uniref:lysozyme n=1 Tax=Brevundimonas bacteroides TaxID=74311 RepID=UPI00068E0745|nr:lysozyme [Brevundimonas bacteroides]